MSGEHHVPPFLFAIFAAAMLLAQASQAASFKSGKINNITARSSGLFACEKITFEEPFSRGKQVKVFLSPGNSTNGAAVWVESEDHSQFRACIYEYSDGSNAAAELNWIALESAPSGAQLGTTSLDSWTTGTKCKKVDFPQRFLTPPIVLATPSHQFPERPEDAMAVWVEDLTEHSFKLCLREVKIFDGLHRGIKINWMAYTNLTVVNFTLSESLVLRNKNSPPQNNEAFCENINFTMPLYAPPVVIVTAKRVSNNSQSSGCDAIAAWVEYTNTTETQICVRNYDPKSKDTINVDYLVFGDPDPCIDVYCNYHGLCKAFGPYDARCVCIDSCPSFQVPICSSNGTTFDNDCFYKQEMCMLQLNHTVQHPGSCEGFPYQRSRLHMPHIPSLGYSHCEVIHLRPFVFYPDKPVQVQVTVNHVDTRDMNYVHDAAVSWIEDVSVEQFTACVMAAGFNERKSRANVSIDWIAYQGAPDGGVSGEVRMSQWWTGTTCKTVNFPSSNVFSHGRHKVPEQPSVFITAAHHRAGLKRDAASVWLEDISLSSFKICLRELQNYAGSHEDISVNWLAFSSIETPFFSEHNSIYFANSQPPQAWNNNAFCRDISFVKVYKNAPSVFVSANHTSSVGGVDPMHNSITAWVEYINTTGARVCLKELYESKYDPLSVSYTVMTDICQTEWSYFDGYCYLTSRACATWLTAQSNCSTMSSNLVTVYSQEENVYIQHRHNGERSWIGLNDRSVEGSFAWASKDTSNFELWAPNQPNDWKNEDCVHTLGARHRYEWNDVSCDNCFNYTCFKDLDECATNAYTCGVNAECRNTVGSYICVCKVGYTGDAYTTCTDINECTRRTHNCHPSLGRCVNTVGSFSCFCINQFTGDGRICSRLVDECQAEPGPPYKPRGKRKGYMSLTNADRTVNFGVSVKKTDKGEKGWFRFEGSAGTKMKDSCPRYSYRYSQPRSNTCNTNAPGWMSGSEPNVNDGQVTRTACFTWNSNCCYWSTSITVRNCGSYLVYHLTSTPDDGTHSLRYCGNG